jgi:hypothetical protein
MSSLALLVRMEELLVPLAWTGAAIAVVAILAAGIAYGASAMGAGGALGAVWSLGLLLSLTAIFVGQWLPVTCSIAALGGATALGVCAGAIRRYQRRPQYRRLGVALDATPASTLTAR